MKQIIILLNMVMLLPFYCFSQSNRNNYKEVNPNKNNGGFSLVDKWAMYPNGIEGINQYIKETIQYPNEAKSQKVEGKVIVEYVVESDGTIGEIKVIQSVHPLLDEEAKRIIKTMGRWKPAMQKGKPIKVAYQQVFNFMLN